MSDQVKVARQLVFTGDAAQEPNIEGNLNPVKKFVSYDFTELALDATNKYTNYIDTTSAVALASGGVTLTTAATDTKTCSMSAGGIWWYPAKNPVVEMRFQLDVVTTVAINVGFSDAVSEGSGALPFTISGTTVTDTATNAAMFCFDTNQTTKYWYIVNTKANTEGGTILPSSCAPVAATDVVLRVALDSSGNARYYYNGVEVGYKASATTSTTPLVGYFGIRNNTATAHIATLKYIRYWCDM
ncbi:MAG: hypothetical protein WC639_04650 [Patescibacteria group bacterium]|jgi:hypothetical protein